MNTTSDSLGVARRGTSPQKQNHTGFKLAIAAQMLCIIGLLGYIATSKQETSGDNELLVSMSVLEDSSAKVLVKQAELNKELEGQKLTYIAQKSEIDGLRSRMKLLEDQAASISTNLVTRDTLTKAVTLSAQQSIELTKAMTERVAEDLESTMTKKDKVVVQTLARSVAETVVVDAKQQDAIKTLNRKVDRIYNRLNLQKSVGFCCSVKTNMKQAAKFCHNITTT